MSNQANEIPEITKTKNYLKHTHLNMTQKDGQTYRSKKYTQSQIQEW